jgi:hypothetical protein
MAATHKKQRILVVSGFLFVAVAFGGQILAVYYHSGQPNVGYEVFFGAGYTLGYGLLAWATWSLFRWLETRPAWDRSLTKALRLFAAANLAFAIGLMSVTYLWAHLAINNPYDGRLSIAIPTTYGLQLFGFCLVSYGFWSAGSVQRMSDRLVPTPDESSSSEMTAVESTPL